MLLELHGFSGRTEVLGFVREVAFANGVLSLGGFDLAEANRILKALETGKLVGVEPSKDLISKGNGAAGVAVAAPLVALASTAPASPKELERLRQKLGAPPVALASSVPAGPEELERLRAKLSEAPAPASPDDALVEKFARATQFKHIVSALAEAGLDEKGIAETCLRIRDRVPLLARMENIERRVPVTLAAMEK